MRAVCAMVMACTVLVAGGCGDGREAAAPDSPVGTEIGHRAPPLTGTGADGREFQFQPRGDGTVIVFFRSFGCGLCRERLRELQGNLDEYRGADVRIVAATPDGPDIARRAVDELGLGFDVVSADSATLANWGVAPGERGLPLPGSYLVDRGGVVIFRHIGRNAADRAHDLEILAALRHARGR